MQSLIKILCCVLMVLLVENRYICRNHSSHIHNTHNHFVAIMQVSCVTWHPQLGTKDFIGAEINHPHVLVDSN